MVEGVMRRVAICLLAGAGTVGAVGGWSAPAQAAQLSQGVARPSVAATQQPRAGGARASASASGAARASQAPPSTSFGFDACAAPSQKAMSAWAKSPYRSIGVYVGGPNRACAQPNLTTEWVTTQLAAGWRLIPTFVGRQAPTSSCGSCAKFGGAKATELGAEEAKEAVADVQAIGIGTGNPVYFDMEAYAETSAARNATLAFLEAWTRKLHALGYVSGVYSSSASGIADLASRLGSGYAEPDDVWIAEWNGEANTYAPLLPSEAWQPHHRLHQYRGGHNETYGGVTINIDNDYVDGDVVGAAAPPPPLAVPRVAAGGYAVSVTIACGLAPEASCPGQIILRAYVRVRRAGGARTVRVGIARRGFTLHGGRTHAFRVALNSRGQALLRRRGAMKAQLLVAIPGARVTKGLVLRLG